MIEVITQSAAETKKLGEILGQELLKFVRSNFRSKAPKKFRSFAPKKRAIVVGLAGELGSGKTVFIQGLAKGLGIKDRMTSPTFVIIRKYKINVSSFKFQVLGFCHIDCYRLQQAKELLDLGFKEIIKQPANIIAIEWAERVRRILPADTFWIKFEHFGEQKRKIVINSEL